MLWLIAIGCFIAILFINAHEKDKAARRKYNAQATTNAVAAGHAQQELIDDVDQLKEMVDIARAKILQQKALKEETR